eukprot:1149309-Pelagomonas_calceolata.AAC.1
MGRVIKARSNLKKKAPRKCSLIKTEVSAQRSTYTPGVLAHPVTRQQDRENSNECYEQVESVIPKASTIIWSCPESSLDYSLVVVDS